MRLTCRLIFGSFCRCSSPPKRIKGKVLYPTKEHTSEPFLAASFEGCLPLRNTRRSPKPPSARGPLVRRLPPRRSLSRTPDVGGCPRHRLGPRGTRNEAWRS